MEQMFQAESYLSVRVFPAEGNSPPYPFPVIFPESLLYKVQIFHKKSDGQKRKIQNHLQYRHILINQINVIARRMDYLKTVMTGAAGGAPYVVYLRLRGISVIISMDSRPIGQIHIF